jgi:ubiquinone/menaquinone biosynthesis C-methylase UbiE
MRSLTLRCLYFLIGLFLIRQAHAQEKNPCLQTYLTRPRTLNDVLTQWQLIYAFGKKDVVASVGVGTGNKEIVYSMMADSLTFYLQDISSRCLSAETIAQATGTFYTLTGRTCTATFIPIIGTETETKLPRNTFDKIIIENSLHEFGAQDEMLIDIRGALRADGMLFIFERIAKKPGKLHQGCKKPLFTEESMIALLARNGYQYFRTVLPNPGLPDDRVLLFGLAK